MRSILVPVLVASSALLMACEEGPRSPLKTAADVPGAGAQVSRTWQNSGGLGRGASTLFVANDYVYGAEISWQTADSWPVTNPGTAFGVIPQ